MEQVILVDEHDVPVGTMEKLQAHQEGKLHRAISVFIFNTRGELLLQQRAAPKYHSANLWTNTCCSHPRPGEDTSDAAVRRLREEMGIACGLEEQFHFIYHARLDHALTEYELDHVFTGVSDATPQPDNSEVADWKYMPLPDIDKQIETHPEIFTEWFKICVKDWRHMLITK